jgi:Tol biopolymer transport system component
MGGGITPPYWSPDGRRLTLSANIEGHSDVYVIGASGGNPRRLTFGRVGSANPSWSRDGGWILFDTVDSGIFKVPAEAGRAVRVSPAAGWAPLESPDGKFLYGIGNGPDGYSLWRVATGGGKAQLVLSSLDHYTDYALVEDGIYFIPKRDPRSCSSIQYLNTATGNVQRLASVENPVRGLTVSPDRRWILYSRVERADSNLMLVENFR